MALYCWPSGACSSSPKNKSNGCTDPVYAAMADVVPPAMVAKVQEVE